MRVLSSSFGGGGSLRSQENDWELSVLNHSARIGGELIISLSLSSLEDATTRSSHLEILGGGEALPLRRLGASMPLS